MSPPSGPFSFSQHSAPSSSFYKTIHRLDRDVMLGYRASLGYVYDAASAQLWVSAYGKATREYLDSAEVAGNDPDSDTEACQLSMDAREALFDYATSAWLDLVPHMVQGMEDFLSDLPAGETFGGLSIVETPSPLACSSSSKPSRLSAPYISRESSTGSAILGAVSSVPAATPSDRELCSLPLRNRVTPPAPIAPAPVEAVVDLAEVARQKLVDSGASVARPSDWLSCLRCQHHKKRCAPAVLDKPPYLLCFLCLSSHQKTCVRVAKSSGASHSTSIPTRKSSRLRGIRLHPPPGCAPTPQPPSLPKGQSVDSPLLSALPTAVPLYGSNGAPLPALIAWHAEIFAARDECRASRATHGAAEGALQAARAALKAAQAALEAAMVLAQSAASRIAVTDDRLLTAWRNYHTLVHGVVSDGFVASPAFPESLQDKGNRNPATSSRLDRKGKEKAQGPPSDAGDGEEFRAESEGDREDEGRGMEWSN